MSSPLCRILQPWRQNTCWRGNQVRCTTECLWTWSRDLTLGHTFFIDAFVFDSQTLLLPMASMWKSSQPCTSFKISTLRARVAFRSSSEDISTGQGPHSGDTWHHITTKSKLQHLQVVLGLMLHVCIHCHSSQSRGEWEYLHVVKSGTTVFQQEKIKHFWASYFYHILTV